MASRWLLGTACILAALGATPQPAAAMCGGNIFMTCPPSTKSEASQSRASRKLGARRRNTKQMIDRAR